MDYFFAALSTKRLKSTGCNGQDNFWCYGKRERNSL